MFADLMSAKTDEQREQIKSARQEHRDRCTAFRKLHSVRMELGISQPDHFLSLIIDGMDNQKTMIPRLEGVLHSKKLHDSGKGV